MLGSSSNLRRRATAPHHAGALHSQAPYANGDDDDWMTPRGLFMGFCCCLGSAIVITTLAFVAVLLFRVVPPKALSATCDDTNPCTLDFLETVRGVDSGCCSHCNLPNEAECTSACYTSPQCVDGECKGTCKGHCEELNALDCPKINSVNISTLLGFAGTGNDGNGTFYELYRECAFSSCMYTIRIVHVNASLHSANGFVASIVKQITAWGLNTTTNNTNQHEVIADDESVGDIFRQSVCMPLIATADRVCLKAFWVEFSVSDTATPLAFSMACKYMYDCSDPPSYGGSVEFPARIS